MAAAAPPGVPGILFKRRGQNLHDLAKASLRRNSFRRRHTFGRRARVRHSMRNIDAGPTASRVRPPDSTRPPDRDRARSAAAYPVALHDDAIRLGAMVFGSRGPGPGAGAAP